MSIQCSSWVYSVVLLTISLYKSPKGTLDLCSIHPLVCLFSTIFDILADVHQIFGVLLNQDRSHIWLMVHGHKIFRKSYCFPYYFFYMLANIHLIFGTLLNHKKLQINCYKGLLFLAELFPCVHLECGVWKKNHL